MSNSSEVKAEEDRISGCSRHGSLAGLHHIFMHGGQLILTSFALLRKQESEGLPKAAQQPDWGQGNVQLVNRDSKYCCMQIECPPAQCLQR